MNRVLRTFALAAAPLSAAGLLLTSFACTTGSTKPSTPAQLEAEEFLEDYTEIFQGLYTSWVEADWEANTKIVEGDDSRDKAVERTRQEFARFTGSVENIETARALLERGGLLPLQEKQLEKVLYKAAANPQTEPDLVARLIAAETKQVSDLFGFEFRLDGQSVTTNELDSILRESTDLGERQRAWEASKEVGAALKPGLANLRDLRNAVVRALGYEDYYSYQVSDYGMGRQEMNALMERLNREIRPLYRELHTWVRYELAERYGVPVPDTLPAHWLPNRWAQDWSALVEVEGFDIDAALAGRDPAWVTKQGEDFYVSLGFAPLPQSFWDRSSLYPLPADAPYKKNNHASAWHVNLDEDVRTLMSIEPNAEWYETVHHELGHIYYFMEYSTPDVPLLLREGANRAFHEAIGSMLGLAAMQPPFLAGRGLIDGDVERDEIRLLLREALNHVVFVPFGAGTMPSFEHALYAEELPTDQFNAKWWEIVERFQGVSPPNPRGEEHADGLSKTHIHNDAAQYYDYALSYVLMFQIHEHIAREILGADPRETNYFGRKDVGRFLHELLSVGATEDWSSLLQETIGSDMSAEPMLAYFAPLLEWLREQNRGRQHSLADV